MNKWDTLATTSIRSEINEIHRIALLRMYFVHNLVISINDKKDHKKNNLISIMIVQVRRSKITFDALIKFEYLYRAGCSFRDYLKPWIPAENGFVSARRIRKLSRFPKFLKWVKCGASTDISNFRPDVYIGFNETSDAEQ